MKKPTNPRVEAAKQIRHFTRGLGIKASVTSEAYAGGSSITIILTDQKTPIVEKVKAFAKDYQYGHFDGMQDCYIMSDVKSDLPQVSYVNVENHLTIETKEKVWAELKETDPNIPSFAVRHDWNEFYNDYGDTLIRRKFLGIL
ncbi:MAG: hypothetical protein OEY89_12260 [Gammaproteobacteria bacterium]|nr:hypothetical protein [Gammaproteobacteria bacterium]